METFATSDDHFNHTNIIKYCSRPFLKDATIPDPYSHDWNLDTNTMNRALMENWNRRVKPTDRVIHIGDFAMGDRKLIPNIRKRLNGRIILIKGNHDPSIERLLEYGFDEVYDSLKIELDGRKVFLHHQPLPKTEWEDCEYHLCGHVHGKWARQGNTINVGVDVRDYEPKTFEELLR